MQLMSIVAEDKLIKTKLKQVPNAFKMSNAHTYTETHPKLYSILSAATAL